MPKYAETKSIITTDLNKISDYLINAKKTVGVLYQAIDPPIIDGMTKPPKPGGYADSGADIAYTLRQASVPMITPAEYPQAIIDTDWVFEDTFEGIRSAQAKGARVLWANTVLFRGHPIDKAIKDGLIVIGQRSEDVEKFDDKFRTNKLLRSQNIPTAPSVLISNIKASGSLYIKDVVEKKLNQLGLCFSMVIKPIRGRGSEGVDRVDTLDDLQKNAQLLFETFMVDQNKKNYPRYGNNLILEQYLPGEEITITVMPPGEYVINQEKVYKYLYWCLPPVRRFNHIDGIAPYNGVVAVTKNSYVVEDSAISCSESLLQVIKNCERAGYFVNAAMPIRIDCRMNADGCYLLFDLNMKPNMTGPGRPGRDNQDSLVAIAARHIGWSYSELLLNILWSKISNKKRCFEHRLF